MKQRYYRLKNVLKTNCPYILLFAERSNGKSYAVKEYVIQDFFKNGNEFIYLRRYKDEITADGITDYFEDLRDVIIRESKGKYDFVERYNGKIYFVSTDEEGNTTRGERFGHIALMSKSVYYKSRNYAKVMTIVYEEFMTKGLYVQREPKMFMDFVSTVFRRRMGKVFMVANTVSRVSPYIREWGLKGLLTQEQGTIDVYHMDTGQKLEDGRPYIIDLAVEYCEESGGITGMVFGSDAITKGSWDVDFYPSLPDSWQEYDVLYRVGLLMGQFDFVLELLASDEGVACYIYPKPDLMEITRCLQESPVFDPLISRRLDPKKFEVESLVIDLFKQGKVFYADCQTGTDFTQCNKEYGGIY